MRAVMHAWEQCGPIASVRLRVEGRDGDEGGRVREGVRVQGCRWRKWGGVHCDKAGLVQKPGGRVAARHEHVALRPAPQSVKKFAQAIGFLVKDVLQKTLQAAGHIVHQVASTTTLRHLPRSGGGVVLHALMSIHGQRHHWNATGAHTRVHAFHVHVAPCRSGGADGGGGIPIASPAVFRIGGGL